MVGRRVGSVPVRVGMVVGTSVALVAVGISVDVPVIKTEGGLVLVSTNTVTKVGGSVWTALGATVGVSDTTNAGVASAWHAVASKS